MEGFISFIKYLATSNFINFVIMLMILCWIVRKINLKVSLESSIEKIKSAIEESESKKNNSEKKLRTVHAAMEKLPQKISKYQEEIETRTDDLKQKIGENANLTISNINSNIDKDLILEEKKLSNNLREYAIQKSIDVSTDRIKNLLLENPNMHEKFINKSLEELDKVNLR